jgi:uncharacterized protein with PIN domain
VTFESDDQRFDLCASCRQVVLEALTKKVHEEIPQEEVVSKPSSPKSKNKGVPKDHYRRI